ncbi:MAG TPA: RNA polymerase sigma factor [Chitinophagales bacterium]|nr:RNA polymerase sigma factor [Chitinophagales bacterium]HNM32141.1 RNA polymerase sigma factor [Chitinophagales bacterium]
MSRNLAHLSDIDLVELYKKDFNTLYIGELYKRYSLLVYGLSYKYLKDEIAAQDAVTEIFEAVIFKLKTHEVSFFKSWLFILAKNYLLRSIEKNNKLEINSIENISEKFMENDTDLYLNRQEEESELLQRAISNLNEEQRTCIDLFYYQLKPYQEVASMTGYDLNKVKSAIQNGKRNLKKFMEENNRTNG